MAAALILAVFSLATTLGTWQKSPMVGAVPILVAALGVSLLVVIRRALRRASGLIDEILHEELDAHPVAAESSSE